MNIKKKLQEPLRRRQAAKYEAMIQEQTVSYHDWIVRKEQKERSGQEHPGNGMSVKCVALEDCGAGFVLTGERLTEIVVFHPANTEVTEDNLNLIRDYFAQHPETALLYGDEDETLPENGGRRTRPWLKPDWSPDTLITYFYFGNIFAVRTEAVRDIPWPDSADWKANVYDFCLRAADRMSVSGTSASTGQTADGIGCSDNSAAGTGSIIAHLDSILLHNTTPIRHWGMEEEYADLKRQAYIRRGWPLEPTGKVSIIIPSKDNPGVLSTCIHSVLEASTYRDFEIIVVDNGSSEHNRKRIQRILDQMQPEYHFRYVYEPMEFNFSRMCNRGVELAAGDYILLLNDDVEIIHEDWLEKMMSHAVLPHVGAVGVKLLYPSGKTIQHAGITNIRLGPAHKLQFRPEVHDYYFGRNKLPQDVLGVTGACLLVKRSVYEAAGGFKESLRVAFNDVDFCYTLHDMGYVNVVRNDVILYHHESLSRGLDDNVEKLKRLHQELNLLYELHPSIYGKDPYYHRYLVKDVLDQEFHAGNRYEYEEKVDAVVPEAMTEGLRPEWSNEVLRMGIEFAGDLSKWETGQKGSGDYFIQGWCYALQVDNRQYRFNLLLKPVNRGDGPAGAEEGAVWKLPVSRKYRPDIQQNLGHLQHMELPGVCLNFPRTALPQGEYLIGFLWEDTCSRQKLYQWTAETLEIVH